MTLKYFDRSDNLVREVPKNNLRPFEQDEKHADLNGEIINNPDFNETTAKQRAIDLIVNDKEVTNDMVASYVLPRMIQAETNNRLIAAYNLMLTKVTERIATYRQKILDNT